MKGKIGVWINLEKAVLIAINGNSHNVETMDSPVESRVRFIGEGNQSGRFGDQFVDNKKARDHRKSQQVQKFAHDVVAHLSAAEEIVIFGPAEMKLALKKAIEEQPTLSSKLKGVETADSMTDNQLVAWVKDYFRE